MNRVVFVLLFLVSPAHATWKPQYADATPAVRDWYESRELTPAAQLRFHFKSCCANSDVVKTKFKAGTGDEWYYFNGDTWRKVPDDIIHWGEPTPDGQAIMFAVGGEPVCFFPADSGG